MSIFLEHATFQILPYAMLLIARHGRCSSFHYFWSDVSFESQECLGNILYYRNDHTIILLGKWFFIAIIRSRYEYLPEVYQYADRGTDISYHTLIYFIGKVH